MNWNRPLYHRNPKTNRSDDLFLPASRVYLLEFLHGTTQTSFGFFFRFLLLFLVQVFVRVQRVHSHEIFGHIFVDVLVDHRAFDPRQTKSFASNTVKSHLEGNERWSRSIIFENHRQIERRLIVSTEGNIKVNSSGRNGRLFGVLFLVGVRAETSSKATQRTTTIQRRVFQDRPNVTVDLKIELQDASTRAKANVT